MTFLVAGHAWFSNNKKNEFDEIQAPQEIAGFFIFPKALKGKHREIISLKISVQKKKN